MSRLALFLATSGHSGVDRVMKNLIVEFASRGHGVDLLRIENHGPHLETVPEGVRLVPLGTSHVNGSLWPLVRYLRRERPTALLVDKDKLNRLALWARRIARVPTRVAVRMGTTVSENLARRSWLQRQVQYFSIRHFYPWAEAIIVPSQGAARDLALVGRLPLERIRVIPSPVVTADLARLAAGPVDHPWFSDGADPVILGVGELCVRKDFSTLIRAFAFLRKRKSARLVILGEGRQREQLEELAMELGIGKDVSLPGFVSNPYAFMARAAMFVLSSRCEGSPVVLMEALATGCPAVSTDCPSGPREILQDGTFGSLVPVGDVAALARAMERTLDHRPAVESLKTAAAPYSVSASAEGYLAALGLGKPE
jgi:glycosyltransferase involved in cell wall biosynthesis